MFGVYTRQLTVRMCTLDMLARYTNIYKRIVPFRYMWSLKYSHVQIISNEIMIAKRPPSSGSDIIVIVSRESRALVNYRIRLQFK